MSVNRHPTRNFTIVENSLIDNPDLSLGAKGLLNHFLRNSPGWKMRIDYLIEHTKASKYSLKRYLKELKDAGKIDRKPYYDYNNKRFAGSYYILKETDTDEKAVKNTKNALEIQPKQNMHKNRGSAITESLQNKVDHNNTDYI